MATTHFARTLLMGALIAALPLTGIPESRAGSFMALPGLATSDKAQDKKSHESVSVPEGLDQEKVDGFVAQLSDEQVRRLLINELRQAALAKLKEPGPPQPDGFTRIVQLTGETMALVHARIDEFTVEVQNAPSQISNIYKQMKDGGKWASIPGTLLFLSLMLAATLIWGFAIHRRRTGTWGAGEESCDLRLSEKARRQSILAVRDAGAVLVLAVPGMFLFFLLLDDHGAARMMFLTYLGLMFLVCAVYVTSNFILSPGAPALRLVPLSDDAAVFIHKWVMAIFLVMGTGLLVTVFLELTGVPETLFNLIDACMGMVVFLMVLCIMLVKRKPITRFLAGRRSAALGGDAEPSPGPAGLYWFLAAVFYLFATWCLWALYLLLGRVDMVVAVFALLSAFPLFVLLNRMGQKLLDTVFGFLEWGEGVGGKADKVTVDANDPAAVEQTQCKPDAPGSNFGRFITLMRHCLTLCIAALVCFWVLFLWGFNVLVGETVMSAALEVLFVVTLSYAAWKVIESAINRRLSQIEASRPDAEEEGEGSAEGGSRAGTLLHLLRKFLFVALVTMVVLIVLSAIGINIAPLLAGAGILGLAIGFGTQTLVKDIVSGVFFLIDDAFRIGDYVDTGKLKGTVEHISIRSLQLRHHRGMVHTIPFSDLKSVTNYSRDYNIEKIDVRVPFDTDVDQVRKIVKKINKELTEDVELGGKLLAPIKSQGVREVDDSAMIIRIKFKTRPGDQYAIKREIFTKLQGMFEDKGIQFAHRHVIVRLPEDTVLRGQDSREDGKHDSSLTPGEQLVASGAAAAVATALAEEEAKRRKLEEEKEKG